jgi:hypothetical protein
MVSIVKSPVYVVVAGESPTPDEMGREATTLPPCQRYAYCSASTTSIHFGPVPEGIGTRTVGRTVVGVLIVQAVTKRMITLRWMMRFMVVSFNSAYWLGSKAASHK